MRSIYSGLHSRTLKRMIKESLMMTIARNRNFQICPSYETRLGVQKKPHSMIGIETLFSPYQANQDNFPRSNILPCRCKSIPHLTTEIYLPTVEGFPIASTLTPNLFISGTSMMPLPSKTHFGDLRLAATRTQSSCSPVLE